MFAIVMTVLTFIFGVFIIALSHYKKTIDPKTKNKWYRRLRKIDDLIEKEDLTELERKIKKYKPLLFNGKKPEKLSNEEIHQKFKGKTINFKKVGIENPYYQILFWNVRATLTENFLADNFVRLKCTGDGNCLVNCFSILIFGEDNWENSLRIRIAIAIQKIEKEPEKISIKNINFYEKRIAIIRELKEWKEKKYFKRWELVRLRINKRYGLYTRKNSLLN